ncbi:phosphatidylcholine/phosphatidylserine synthase [Mesorhizobium sp. M00.F.Ca.ET.149.01.1.1]|nr:phosphatidylcholine/phosphatidylserine synthase [Mesorhizobium sp. M00.F.Ca.ET.149.01.1.1]
MGAPFKKFEAHASGGPRIREIPMRMVLPNLVTVLAICAGLSGIRFAFENRFEIAVVMVLLAAFLDGIDGRLARMLKATSKFGAQMDSLADIVNFGVAPALVLYAFLLDRAGSPGWSVSSASTLKRASRMPQAMVKRSAAIQPAWQSEYFVGVPAPAGAVLVMLPLYLYFLRLGLEPSRPAAFLATGFTVLVAFLLVSRLPVYSGKSVKVPGDRVLAVILAVVLYILLLMAYPWYTLTASVAGYLLFLPFSVRAYSKRAMREGEKVPPSDIG